MLATIIFSLVFYFIIFRLYLTFVIAILIILKHATLLRLSNLSPEEALTQAGQDYQAANIDERIQQYLTPSSRVHSIGEFSRFIIATEIGWFIHTSFEIMTHPASSAICRNPCGQQ